MAKSKIQEKIKEEVSEHITEKTAELEAKASAETVWYKKIPYYIAAAVGAVVVEAMNTYGEQIYNAITTAIQSMF